MNVNILATLLLLVAVQVQAQSDVFVCEGLDGVREYHNTPTGSLCKKVVLPHLVIVKPEGVSAGTTAMPPPQDNQWDDHRKSGQRQALEIQLRTAEQRLLTLKKEFNDGQPERRGDERNYAKYQQRVSVMQEEVLRAEKYVETLKRELRR